MPTGEERAWETLTGLDPEHVCLRAGVTYEPSTGCFAVRVFSAGVIVSTRDGRVFGSSPEADALLERLAGHATLSLLWYLTSARDVPLSGRLVKPGDLGGGRIYERGTHVLPLHRVAEKYGTDVCAFLARGEELGGTRLGYADASLRLLPFPRVPVVVLLWKKDAEFAPRAGLLFDSSARYQLPVDIIWSTAMMSLLAVL